MTNNKYVKLLIAMAAELIVYLASELIMSMLYMFRLMTLDTFLGITNVVSPICLIGFLTGLVLVIIWRHKGKANNN